MTSLKRIVKTAAAVAPLVLGAAAPAHGCLLLPNNQGTQNAEQHSPQIEQGPMGIGPNAPFDALQAADMRNGDAPGLRCDPMCDAGQDSSG